MKPCEFSKEHRSRCKRECPNFKLAKKVCEYYAGNYGWMTFCPELQDVEDVLAWAEAELKEGKA